MIFNIFNYFASSKLHFPILPSNPFSLHSLNVCSGTGLRRTFFSSVPTLETKGTLEAMDKKDIFYQ